MPANKVIQLTLSPEEAFNEELFEKIAFAEAGNGAYRLVKRSIDARKRDVKVHIQMEILGNSGMMPELWTPRFKKVSDEKRCVIIGCGPAGMFAALTCLEMGIKPVILERGKDVRERRRDLAALNKEMVVNEDSNYCFGEGGAGTYSDGKLYTRSNKRGDINRVLEILHFHGARKEILYDAHPHIGTNKLPGVVSAMRQTILDGGGEIHFNKRVSGLTMEGESIKGVSILGGGYFEADSFILATGHSARDIYALLHGNNILVEAKPFALGVRIEHPQSIVDQVQYHCSGERSEWLPAASYALKHQSSDGRGVFSFCMCPGGFIVPAATSPGEIVVNGMSPSKRNSFFANSGTVVSVGMDDFKRFERFGPLSGMYFQAESEAKAWELAGRSQVAPAQRITDFIAGRLSKDLPETSYIPGVISSDFREILPSQVFQALKEGVRAFGKKMKGYITEEAQLVGVESRTSAPVRIPRESDTLRHPQIKNLIPCGEGAGYAGGIVSAAMDGSRCAMAIEQN